MIKRFQEEPRFHDEPGPQQKIGFDQRIPSRKAAWEAHQTQWERQRRDLQATPAPLGPNMVPPIGQPDPFSPIMEPREPPPQPMPEGLAPWRHEPPPQPMPIPATPAPLEPPPPPPGRFGEWGREPLEPMVPATPPTATGPGMNVKGGAATPAVPQTTPGMSTKGGAGTPAVPQTTPGMNLKGGPQTPQTPPMGTVMGTVWQPPSQPTPVDPRAEQIGEWWGQQTPQTPQTPPPPDYSEWDNYLTSNYARGGLTRYRRY